MTKLMEWLGAAIAFLAVYLYIITGETNLSDELMLHIILLPIYLIGSFGVRNLSVNSLRINCSNIQAEQFR